MRLFLALLFLFSFPSISVAQTGLIFPDNTRDRSEWVNFQFFDPHLNGLPWFGPGDEGVTFIWEYRPEAQMGYYGVIMYTQGDGNFSTSNMHYGAHPYPQSGNGFGTTHNWELLGMDSHITDFEETGFNGSGPKRQVVNDVWYTQALVISVNGDNSKHARFYLDLPRVASNDFIEHTSPVGWGESTPPDPTITVGQVPWAGAGAEVFSDERANGIIRGLKIWDRALSEAEIIIEAASLDSDTTLGTDADIWYSNVNPTPIGVNPDPVGIQDQSGNGNHPQFYDDTQRPDLYSVPEPEGQTAVAVTFLAWLYAISKRGKRREFCFRE